MGSTASEWYNQIHLGLWDVIILLIHILSKSVFYKINIFTAGSHTIQSRFTDFDDMIHKQTVFVIVRLLDTYIWIDYWINHGLNSVGHSLLVLAAKPGSHLQLDKNYEANNKFNNKYNIAINQWTLDMSVILLHV